MCRTSCTSNADCTSPNVCLGSICAPNPNLKVQYRCPTPMPNDKAMKPHFKVANTGTTAVALSTLTIRYWYTIDTPVDGESSQCDFAERGCNNVTLSNVTLSPTRTNADRYFQVSFAAGAGNLAGGTNTGEMPIWFHKNSWGTYMESSNDHSFDATKTAYADWNRVTLYQERHPRLGHGAVGFGPLTLTLSPLRGARGGEPTRRGRRSCCACRGGARPGGRR